jgi:hypothetical protein
MESRTVSSITRKRYMDKEITHSDYYGAIAELLGESYLRSILPGNRTPEQWRKLASKDFHLNNVSLRNWDSLHIYVVAQVRQTPRAKLEAINGTGGWSLSDSVCVLKETARRYSQTK